MYVYIFDLNFQGINQLIELVFFAMDKMWFWFVSGWLVEFVCVPVINVVSLWLTSKSFV